MNNDSFIINQVDNTALNRFFGKIYGVVAMGIGLSAFVIIPSCYSLSTIIT